MNKFLTTLIAASLAALILAIGCGAWLFWQSWEETKRLERQNRELQATLEASRIRLDNFCEYPMEALCDVNTDVGSVMSSMSGMHEALPEPSSAPAAQPARQDTEEDVQHTGTEVSGRISDAPAPSPEKNAQSSASSPAEPAPVQEEVAPIPPSQEAEIDSDAASLSDAPEQTVTPAPPAEQDSSADQEEGRTSGQTVSDIPDAQPKRTWLTLEQDNNSLKLRIAGAGPSLTARGEKLAEPLRYEVTLEGLWKIARRTLTTTLVTEIRREFRDGNTILTFLLSRQPEQCLLEQEDSRTIAITIQ